MLGWDGLGIISFCLVIYYIDVNSLTSGLLTIYINRLGDVIILLAMSYLFKRRIWLNWRYAHNIELNIILLILLAGFTKRAQIPFSAWLPAAISAPTPVSALVHSSTLVTAGIYLIMRNIFIIRTRILRVVFLFIRILTMIISGLIACMEKDMKKVVAISTLRQLGIIMFVLFRFEISNRFIHIVCHALFKALLFLCCGIFIILRFGSQDSRFIRGYGVLISTTRVMLIRSSLRLMGFPFSSGFYSKDLLIEIRINSMTVLLSFFIALGCIITFFYSLRLLLVGLKTRKLGNFILFLKEPYKELLAMILMFLWICLSGLIIRFILELNSWWEVNLFGKLLGVTLLVVGGFLYYFFRRITFKSWIFSTILFLKWLRTSGISGVMFLFKSAPKRDFLWGEIIGPSGINKVFFSLSILISKFIYSSDFFIIFLTFMFFVFFLSSILNIENIYFYLMVQA